MSFIITKLQRFPYLLLIFATFFWGTNFVFSRMIVDEVPPFQLSVGRWVIASIVFLPFVYKEIKQHLDVLKKNWKPLFFLGLTGIAGFNTLLYIAMQYTTSINASLVNATAPLFIVLLSVFFLREKIVTLQYIGIAISLLGVFIVITGGSLETLVTLTINPGDVIVFGAVIVWAIYSVLMKRFGVHVPKKATFLITMYIGVIMLLPFALYERTFSPISLVALPWETTLAVLYLGIFPSVISFLCWNEGVMQVGPGRASTYLYLIVFFTTLLAVTFGGETITITQIIGGVFLLAGVIVGSNPDVFQKK
ncbi:DMT family transporter [Evansella sp. AB-rgal1]|uniref:DMT family transporter n=1 Tax=Evansella sp. AB-rgal1 TaxID=3242696 RepID=UPI00359CD258